MKKKKKRVCICWKNSRDVIIVELMILHDSSKIIIHCGKGNACFFCCHVCESLMYEWYFENMMVQD